MKYLIGILALAFTLSGCMSSQLAGDYTTANENWKAEATGLYVVTPSGAIFGLGQAGVDRGRTVASVHPDAQLIQASYVQRVLPDGTVELDITDGTTNCTGFQLGAGTSTIDVSAELEKTFCMGIGAQDLAIGLSE